MIIVSFIGGGSPGPTDPDFASVASLLHCEGAHLGTVYTDVTGKTWTGGATSPAFTSTTQAKFGSTSLRASGGTAAYAETTNAGCTIGTADFTWEAWVYRDASGAVSLFWDNRPSLTNGVYPAMYHDASGNLHFFVNNADRITGSGGNLPLNTWTFVAISRVSGSTRLFVGPAGGTATQTGLTYTDSNNYLMGRYRLGTSAYDTAIGTNFSGYLDEVRLTIGSATRHYTTSFTVPVAPFPDS